MKTCPEYALAEALIEHLQRDGLLKLHGEITVQRKNARGETREEQAAAVVYPEPWDRADQCQNLAMAAQQYDMAVAVSPQAPGYLTEDKAAAGYLEARLGVTILTTTQVNGGEAARKVANIAGETLHALMRWDYQALGIPYAAPRISDIREMETGELPDFENLSLLMILVSKEVNYKSYYGGGGG